MRMILKFLKLAISDIKLTTRLIHPRRIKNAVRFLLSDQGNLSQLYRRYQEIYRGNNAAGHYAIVAALQASPPMKTVFILPIIDWEFRFQRPQHIATQLGKLGFRVIYFAATPLAQQGAHYRFTGNPAANVFLCKLQAPSGLNDDLHRDAMSDATRDGYARSLQALMRELHIAEPALLLQHHYWAPLARRIPTGAIGYDCMDHHVAFHDPTGIGVPPQEERLIGECDFVAVSSIYLQQKIAPLRASTLIRNGCESSLFSTVEKKAAGGRPVAGYIGAIAEWFDIRLLAEVATLLPEWDFVLVGSHVGCDVGPIGDLKNVELVGEVDYADVPSQLARFDVCMIPFQLTELTKATNPVKIYEYFSAGKPVVSTPLPEVLLMGDMVLIGDTPEQFADGLRKGLRLAGEAGYTATVRQWASGQDWSQRAGQFAELLVSERAQR